MRLPSLARRSLLTALVPSALASLGLAQSQIDSLSGSATSRFGNSVAFVGDLDGDGHAEWIGGAPEDDSAGTDAGRARVFDGASGSPLYTYDGSASMARLGNSVDGAGLVDADAIPDFVIGSPGALGGLGRVLVLSGADGSTIHDIAGTAPAGEFGDLVTGAGDVDGDGYDDFAASKRLDSGAGTYVYSGLTGLLLFHAPWDVTALDAAGDFNGDGLADVVAGNLYVSTIFNQEGAVRVYLGPSGSLGLDLEADVACLQYGASVAGAGDFNGDGLADILVGGTADACFGAFSPGRMDLLAGPDGALIERFEGVGDFTRFGAAVATAGDVDRDGIMDFVAMEPFSSTLEVRVYSGATGNLITSFYDGLGAVPALAAGGDVDDDGFPDFLVGDPNDASNTGKVEIWTYGCPPNAGYNYCTAAPNSVGPGAIIGYMNTPSVSANNFRLNAAGCPPQTFGIFFYGKVPIEVPFGQGLRCVGGQLFRLTIVNTGQGGTPSYALDITSPPRPAGQITPGSTWFFQFWHRDNVGGTPVFNLTDGLRVTFCP